jgi:diguanylate cyclase (GGDEF)-like protein
MLSRPLKKNLLALISIRAQLLCLLIGIATVILIDRTREISAERAEQIALTEQELLRIAQRGSARETEMISSAKAVLSLAGRDPQIKNDSPTSCQPTFRAASGALPWLVDVSLVSTAGGLVCTSSALTTSRGVADRPYFQQAMQTRDFALSGFLTSRLSHKPVVVAAMPRLSGQEVDAVLVASIDVDWFTRVARATSGLEIADVVLLNGEGTIVSTSTRLTHWIGNSAAEIPDIWKLLNGPDGVFHAKVMDGTERIISHIRLPITKGILLVMRSRQEVLGVADARARAVLAKILALGAACLLIVWFGGQWFVLRPLSALGEAATRFGEGDLKSRVDTRTLAPELATLGNAFNSMSSLLALREEELKRANVRLSDLAATDGLTGIANKRQFDEQMDSEWRRACRIGEPVALIALDVDHFKKFNDHYGHLAGDECLQRVATILKRACRRPGDIAARTGGEEFSVLLPGAHIEDAVAIAESIRLAIKTIRIPHDDSETGYVTASVGVASFTPRPEQSAAALLNAADEALYRAKRAGRNRVVMHQPQIALALESGPKGPWRAPGDPRTRAASQH